jgi:outer membrane protein assembly factor BamB
LGDLAREVSMAHWRQFQANAANQGFVPLSTGPVTSFKWKTAVGPVSFGSPVIGNDGTIYIGNLLAELVAVAPDGTIRWKRALDLRPSTIPGSPAVDANGNIYVVTTYQARVRDHRSGETVYSREARSKLHSVSPDGTLRWTFPFPASGIPNVTGGYTLSSPKISGGPNPFIFVPCMFTRVTSRTEILVIDLAGNLVHRTQVSDYPPPPLTSGGDIFDILDSVWDFLNGAEFNPRGEPNLSEQFGRPAPTLAVADFGNLATQPIVIIDDNYKKLAAFRWSNQRLAPLWEKPSSQPRFNATPAVFLSSQVASGQQDGTLALFDAATGQELWKPWYKAPNPLPSPPASFVSQMYLLSWLHLSALDANAKLIKKESLGMMALGAPALSADRVFINGGDGYYTFSLDLKTVTKNGDFLGGVSSPAIGDDGSVYVMDRNKMLWAFGKQNPTPRRPPRATL